MMSDDTSQLRKELEDLGYQVSVRESPQGTVVEFDYLVEAGSRKGETFKLGISFQEAGYPEYPPHWIHTSPPVNDGLGGVVERYHSGDGQEWVAMSRPPKERWDRLPVKDMRNYLNEHVRRFWNCI